MLDRLVLGDTLNYTTTVDGYPASAGWTLSYRLVPRGAGTPIEFTCTGDGELHRAQVTATATAAWTPGTYSWHSWVTKATEKYTVATGSIVLLADPRTTASNLDLRTDAQIALDAAKAAFKAWTPTTKSYVIGDRQMTFSSAAEIIPVINFWEREVARENRAAQLAKGLPDPRRIYVRLGRG